MWLHPYWESLEFETHPQNSFSGISEIRLRVNAFLLIRDRYAAARFRGAMTENILAQASSLTLKSD
jgi:hypothetical protein